MVKFDFKVSALNHYIILLNCRIPLWIGQDFSSSRQLPYLTNIMGQQKKLSLEIADKPRKRVKKTETPLLTKVCIVKARVFPVVMHGCESWTIKKAEHQRIDAFELWCWRRLLRVSWTTRRSNQSILNEINPEYLLEELILKLKLQYFGHLRWRAYSLEKTLMLGKLEGKRRRGLAEEEMVR